MKNRVVGDMMASQFDWKRDHVEVEFLHLIGSEYTFKVTHYDPDGTDFPVHKQVAVKVDDFVPESF